METIESMPHSTSEPSEFNTDNQDFTSFQQIEDFVWDHPSSPRFYRTLRTLKKYLDLKTIDAESIDHKVKAMRIYLNKKYERKICNMTDTQVCYKYQKQLNKINKR